MFHLKNMTDSDCSVVLQSSC